MPTENAKIKNVKPSKKKPRWDKAKKAEAKGRRTPSSPVKAPRATGGSDKTQRTKAERPKAPVRAGERSSEKPNFAPADLSLYALPGSIVGAWRQTVLQFAKDSRGRGASEVASKDLAAKDAEHEQGGQGEQGERASPRRGENKSSDSRAQVETLMRRNQREIEGLWQVFTRDRQELSKRLLTTEKAAFSYLLGFHLANVARCLSTLDRTVERYPGLKEYIRGVPVVQWNDYGCGTGAMAQAAAHWLRTIAPKGTLNLELSDLGSHLLAIAEELLLKENPPTKVTTHKFSLDTLRSTPTQRSAENGAETNTLFGYSLGYVWNELSRNPRAQAKLKQVFSDQVTKNRDALIVILEPATEAMARSVMQWRDEICQLGYTALYPCPKIQLCPMNARPKDWCYSEFRWQEPVEMRLLDRLIGAGRHRLATAAYVFASPQLMAKLTPSEATTAKPDLKKRAMPEGGVVVGRPLNKAPLTPLKNQKPNPKAFQYLLCTTSGIVYSQPPRPPIFKETKSAQLTTDDSAPLMPELKLRGTVIEQP